MAGQEILRESQVCKRCVSLAVLAGQEAFGCWDKKNLQTYQRLLGEIPYYPSPKSSLYSHGC